MGRGRRLFGDDVGDLPAFAALDDLRRGVATVAVAVLGAETPVAVRGPADVVLDGPAQVVEVLPALAAAS